MRMRVGTMCCMHHVLLTPCAAGWVLCFVRDLGAASRCADFVLSTPEPSRCVCVCAIIVMQVRVRSFVLSLAFGELIDKRLIASFVTYDQNAQTTLSVASVFPHGSWFNFQADVALTGHFINLGRLRCRFGEYEWGTSTWGHFTNSTHVVCEKPAFPDDKREFLGAVSIHFSPNGQCFTRTSASFVVYNSLVDGISPIGSPSITTTRIDVFGAGFPVPGLQGARCFFALQAAEATTQGAGANATAASGADGSANATELAIYPTALTVVSPTRSMCETPAAGIPGARFIVAISLNGVAIEPTKFADQLLRFTEYDLSAVRITSLKAPGGPVGEPTSVTVFGESFASYGAGQLKVRAGGGGADAVLVDGRLLDAERVLCTLPAFPNATSMRIELSLSAGTNGTFSNAAPIPFGVFEQPTVLSVEPTLGDANGGTEVTIRGFGFSALSDNYIVQRRSLRCSFGGTVQTIQPRFHSDEEVICKTTWGAEYDHGVEPAACLPHSFAGSGLWLAATLLQILRASDPPNAPDPRFTGRHAASSWAWR